MKIGKDVSRRDALNWMAAFSGMGAVLAGAKQGLGAPQGLPPALVRAPEIDWQPIVNDLFPPGLVTKPLFENKQRNFSFSLVRYPAATASRATITRPAGTFSIFSAGSCTTTTGNICPGRSPTRRPRTSTGRSSPTRKQKSSFSWTAYSTSTVRSSSALG